MDIVYSIHYSHNYWIILLPALMAASDVISGLIQAQINGTKNSSVMRKGLYRKCGELGTVMLVWVVCLALELNIKYVAAVSLYVAFMEGLSILENIKAMGIRVPDWITKKAEDLDNEINHGPGPKE